MIIIPRDAWGALPARLSSMGQSQFIFLHHTTGQTLGADLSDDWVRNIDRQHHQQGWAGIGYSWLYDAHGQIFEGRGWGKVGAHTVGYNARAHAFAYLGNGDDPLPEAAQESLRWLVREHDLRYGVQPIKGHGEVNPTHCPGNWILAHKGEFRNISPPHSTPQPPTSDNWFEELIVSLPTLDFNNFGLSSGLIDNVQGLLNGAQFGPSQCSIDNRPGPQTLGAVKAFQKMKGLPADGVVGPQTWRALITH